MKKSLLKFAFIPFVLLLLIFVPLQMNQSPPQECVNSKIVITNAESYDKEEPCVELFTEKSFESDPMSQLYLWGGDSLEIDLTIPSGENVYVEIDWDIWFDFIAKFCEPYVSLMLYNGVSEPVNATFAIPNEDTVEVGLSPGSWNLDITNLGECHMCYKVTVRVYGCFGHSADEAIIIKGP